jgi:hypothetical protein
MVMLKRLGIYGLGAIRVRGDVETIWFKIYKLVGVCS